MASNLWPGRTRSALHREDSQVKNANSQRTKAERAALKIVAEYGRHFWDTDFRGNRGLLARLVRAAQRLKATRRKK